MIIVVLLRDVYNGEKTRTPEGSALGPIPQFLKDTPCRSRVQAQMGQRICYAGSGNVFELEKEFRSERKDFKEA